MEFTSLFSGEILIIIPSTLKSVINDLSNSPNQIRFLEIGGPLESICSETINEKHLIASDSKNSFRLNLKQFSEGDLCIETCWTCGIYLPPLFVRFFKLSLQMLARLVKWSNDAITIKKLTPTKPCNYVKQILKPAKSFWKEMSKQISHETLSECLITIFSYLNLQ